MNYVIDGYNLFFRVENEIDPLKGKREQFVITLNSALQCLGWDATLVFDGHEHPTAHCPTKRELSALEIIFPPGGLSADAFILERLRATEQREQEIIGTSYKSLRMQVRQLGAKTQTVESFFKMIECAARAVPPKREKLQRESPDHYRRLLQSFEKKLEEEASD